MGDKLFKAKEAFVAKIGDAAPIVVHKDELVREGHSLLKGREELFEEYVPQTRFDTPEKATAAPGERRRASVRRKSAASKSKGQKQSGGISAADVPGATS